MTAHLDNNIIVNIEQGLTASSNEELNKILISQQNVVTL